MLRSHEQPDFSRPLHFRFPVVVGYVLPDSSNGSNQPKADVKTHQIHAPILDVPVNNKSEANVKPGDFFAGDLVVSCEQTGEKRQSQTLKVGKIYPLG